MTHQLSDRQAKILEFIDAEMRDRGFPPSVREIGAAVGLNSPSTVHAHLRTLQEQGYLRRLPDKPRAIEVRYDPESGAIADKARVRHVPLLGDVAAGTDVLAQQNVEELMPIPEEFTGDGELFMVRVRGTSMINKGILDGDHIIARAQDSAEPGEVVIAGIPGEEATVKTLQRDGDKIVLVPANDDLEPMVFDPDEIKIYGRVVTVMRRVP